MKNFNIYDWIDELEPYVYPFKDDDGVSQFNLLDMATFRSEQAEVLIERMGLNIPFDQDIDLIQFMSLIKDLSEEGLDDFVESLQSLIDPDWSEASSKLELLELLELKIHFPSVDDLESQGMENLVTELLDMYNVPNDTLSEENEELPDELMLKSYSNGYFGGNDDYDLLLKSASPSEYFDSVQKAWDKILIENDNLTINSLVLAMLVITENTVKSIILKEAKALSETSENSLMKEIFIDYIMTKLKADDGRVELVKKFFGSKISDANIDTNKKLRNNLAHDIESVKVVDGSISFNNKNGTTTEVPLQQVHNTMIDQVSKLAELSKKGYLYQS